MPATLKTLLLCCALAWQGLAGAVTEVPPATVGQAVPEVCFTRADGRPACLSQWRGRVVLLNLWATWCTPCRTEMPQLDQVQARLGGPGFEVLALSVDRRGAGAVANYYARNALRRLAVYVDAEVRATEILGARGIPVSLLVDREGRVVQRIAGPVDWSAADRLAAIRQLMAP